MRDSKTSDMIFDGPTPLELLGGSTILLPGTVILSPPPPGDGEATTPSVFLHPCRTVALAIEKTGTPTNPVVADAQPLNPAL